MCNLHINVTAQRYPFLMLTALQSYWTVEIHGKMYPKNNILAIYEIRHCFYMCILSCCEGRTSPSLNKEYCIVLYCNNCDKNT